MEFIETFYKNFKRKIRIYLRSYSRLIVMLKVWMFSLSALFLGAFFVYPQLSEQQKLFNLSVSSDILNEAQSVQMTNIRFYGVDENNTPYIITSRKAQEKIAGSKIINMSSPMADIVTSDGQAINITSVEGIIDQKKELITLQNNVEIFSSEGYEISSAELNFDLKTNIVSSNEQINARADFGKLTSQGLEISEKGNKIYFKGKTTINLFER